MEKRLLNVQAYTHNTPTLPHLSPRLALKEVNRITATQRQQRAEGVTDDGEGGLTGTPLKDDPTGGSNWRMPPPYVSNRLVRLTVPRLLDMDVNPWKKCLNMSKEGRGAFIPSIASLFP